MGQLFRTPEPTRWEIFKWDAAEFCERAILIGFFGFLILLLVVAGLGYAYLLAMAMTLHTTY